MKGESHCKKDQPCLCPVKGIINVVSKKWTVCIISMLEPGRAFRYSELKENLTDISPKSLSDALKLLEREGLIHREVFPEIPPRVEYSLTDEGETLKVAMIPLVNWVRDKEFRNDKIK